MKGRGKTRGDGTATRDNRGTGGTRRDRIILVSMLLSPFPKTLTCWNECDEHAQHTKDKRPWRHYLLRFDGGGLLLLRRRLAQRIRLRSCLASPIFGVCLPSQPSNRSKILRSPFANICCRSRSHKPCQRKFRVVNSFALDGKPAVAGATSEGTARCLLRRASGRCPSWRRIFRKLRLLH